MTATLSGFKKAQQTGVVLRAASIVRTDLDARGRRPRRRRDGDGRRQTNITVESQAIARGLDEQQLRDLPRNSRDIQDFLTLNPNIVGGFDGIQFLGGRTYGASYIQDGQPSSAGIFGELSNAAPGLDAIQEVQVLSNSYSAEYGGLAGVIVSTKRGANRFRGTGFYDYNSNELNALTYAQALNDVSRSDPNADTHDYRYGVSLGGPIVTNRTFFFGNYEGSKLKALGGGSQAIVPTAAMRNGDFSANTFVVRDPLTGVQFPGNRIPADRIDPAARRILDFFYPLPNQANLAAGGYGAFRQILPLSRDRDRADVRVDHELTGRDSLFTRVSWQRRDPDAFTFESTGGNGGAGLTNLGLLDRQSKAITLAGGWTRIWSGDASSTNSAAATARTRGIGAAISSPARLGPQLRLEVPPLAAEVAGLPVLPVLRHEPPVRHSRPAAERLPRSRSVVLLAQQQHDVAEGDALDQVRRHLHAATTRRTATPPARTSRRARTPSRDLRRATRSPTSCSVCRTRCASSAIPAATCRWTRSRTTGRCSRRTTSS